MNYKIFVLCLSLSSFAQAGIQLNKEFDGKIASCIDTSDVGSRSYIVDNLNAVFIDGERLLITYDLQNYQCAKNGNTFSWQEISDAEAQSTQTGYDLNGNPFLRKLVDVKMIIASTYNSKVLSATAIETLSSKNVAVDVRAIDTLSPSDRRIYARTGKATATLEVFKSSIVHIKTQSNSSWVSYGQVTGGSFKAIIEIEAQDDSQNPTVRSVTLK